MCELPAPTTSRTGTEWPGHDHSQGSNSDERDAGVVPGIHPHAQRAPGRAPVSFSTHSKGVPGGALRAVQRGHAPAEGTSPARQSLDPGAGSDSSSTWSGVCGPPLQRAPRWAAVDTSPSAEGPGHHRWLPVERMRQPSSSLRSELTGSSPGHGTCRLLLAPAAQCQLGPRLTPAQERPPEAPPTVPPARRGHQEALCRGSNQVTGPATESHDGARLSATPGHPGPSLTYLW